MTEGEREDLRKILEEIRDLEREHLDEYRRATRRSLSIQEEASARQEQIARIYRIAMIGAVVLIIGIVALILYLMTLLQPYR